MKKYAIIVAGGSGSRMNTDLPKQFLELAGRPLLMHTIDAFYNFDPTILIILVLPQEHIPTWERLILDHEFDTPHQVAIGGSTRFNSVENGLNLIGDDGIVAIHDGARPMISSAVIQRTFDQASDSGNGVAAVKVKDSIRQVLGKKSSAVDRNNFYIVQTPQTFKVDLIKRAFTATTTNQFTDDASVAEANGEEIVLVEGSYENIKITTPEDLAMAATVWAERK
ncbi:MAG: 2-C-methyl-D-erythritol 4-phosphate cytidylyltransferase [Reichenbachiella sp.]|uniref:2-C-methyl-D-erythritol 4-phosphate cytidylyltransferase n=1 Tax=Reichenbachiella sp. TaxID=2184521 RepID=UPI003264C57A